MAHHDWAAAWNRGVSDGAALPGLIDALKAEITSHEVVLLSSEAMQNIQRTNRLMASVRAIDPAEVQVLCYVRECVDYAVSAYRQKIQAKSEFISFGQYLRRFGSLAPFVARWRAVGDLSLVWFERGRFAGGDVTEDLAGRLGLRGLKPPAGDVNPSIGGNLLYFKALANKSGRGFLSYTAMSRLASAVPGFDQAFHVPDELVEMARRPGGYNDSLQDEIGPPPVLKNWSHLPVLPVADRLTADADLLDAQLDRAGLRPWLSQALRDEAPLSLI